MSTTCVLLLLFLVAAVLVAVTGYWFGFPFPASKWDWLAHGFYLGFQR